MASRHIFSGLAMVAAGALIGVASAAVSVQWLGVSPAAPGSPWELRNFEADSFAHPYVMAHYLLDGRLPPPPGQFAELTATSDAQGSRLAAECVYELKMDSKTQPKWWSLAAHGGRKTGDSQQNVLAGNQAVADADGMVTIVVAATPQPGNWLKAPGSGSYDLLYLAALPGSVNGGRPAPAALFSITGKGC